MSECVVRMEMPAKDKACGMVFDLCGVWYCPVKKRICSQPDKGAIPSWCPIICSLPEGHGPLVDSEEDASKYITVWDCNCSEFGRQTVMAVEDLQYLPIIVPAERKDNGETC